MWVPITTASESTTYVFNHLHARDNFYHLLITFANSLDPVQDQQNDSAPERTFWQPQKHEKLSNTQS